MGVKAEPHQRWVPCAETGYRVVEGTLVQGGKFFAPSDAAAAGKNIPLEKTRLYFFEDSPCEDNTALTHLDDANILFNLQRRYAEDEIYTYTCNVLLAVNPYKKLPLFDEETKQQYQSKNLGMLPPHPYAVADVSYRSLICEKNSQSLIISGESGAGKTETAKIVMHYLATVVSRTDTSSAENIQEKVLNANPILESFGNAQTLRNRNSSRFGKYNKMFFNPIGSLVGSGISTYLLESSRVCVQNGEERNYHIFYELLHGFPQLGKWELTPNRSYKILNPGDTSKNSPENDKSKFQHMWDAFRAIGIDEGEIESIFQIIAALIHLGEFKFHEKEDQTGRKSVSDEKGDEEELPEIELENFQEIIAAELLGFDEVSLLSVLQWRTVMVKHRESFYRVPRTLEQAEGTLQALTKTLYKRLFERIIAKINALSCSNAQNVNHIGILDIYGFERLTTNSFEQLCINLANERLQQFFIENVLLAEQSIYTKEGLSWTDLPLPNSWPVVNAVKGIFTILDDHSLRKIKNLDTNDDKFTQGVHDKYVNGNAGDGRVRAPKLQGGRNKTMGRLLDGFVVKHYAGEVFYTTRKWFDKNNDRLSSELETLIKESRVPLVSELACVEASEKSDKFVSVGKSYVENLEQLCQQTLSKNTLHYIRCFNPNGQQRKESFDPKYVLEQILQSGTVELVHVMHDGYPHRVSFEELQQRFLKLLPEDFQHYDRRTFVESIMKAFEIDPRAWELGVSKLFLRAGQLRTLESLKESGSGASKEVLSRLRRDIVRKKIKRVKHAVTLCLWMPRFIRQIRREKLIGNLRSACFVLVRLYRWLDYSRGIIRRRFLEEQRRKQQRQLSADGQDGLHFSRPRSFVCKALVGGKENLIFTDGKSLFCCVHGERTVGPIYQVNILTGKIHKAVSTASMKDYNTSSGSPAEEGGGGVDAIEARKQPFPDVCAITQHPKYAFRFAIADVEGRVWFVDWHGIREEDTLLYSVSSVFHGMAHCQPPRALIRGKLEGGGAGGSSMPSSGPPSRGTKFASKGTTSGQGKSAGSEQQGGSSSSSRGRHDESLLFQEVALIRHLAYLPYDITKRNVVVALVETTVEEESSPVFFLQLLETCSSTRPQKVHDTQLVDTSMARLRGALIAKEKDRRKSNTPETAAHEIFAFLTPTCSGKMVVLGGCALLNCYTVAEQKGKLKLDLEYMLGCKYLDIEMRNLRSCICLRRSIPATKEKKSLGDFVIVGASDGTLYGFPFTYVIDRGGANNAAPGTAPQQGRFIFDDENAGRFDVDEGEEKESIELLFPIQKNYFTALENKFVSIRRTQAFSWVMGEKDGIFGWHPQEFMLSGLPPDFTCAVSSRVYPSMSLFVKKEESTGTFKIIRWNRNQNTKI
ncbi:unnamed protein product [Amoebophrya sp. A25]|nr:unnamed protein product [Amoebophrya sp. A25]|eukprot:GSA25T00025596001.1